MTSASVAPQAAGDNPSQLESAESVVFVIFGATGDLARRKLFPALYQL